MTNTERLRLARECFDYANQPKVRRTACPACQAPVGKVIRLQDRCGWPVQLATCSCGLAYLVEILTPEGYQTLYGGSPSPYRQICWRFMSSSPYDQLRYDQYHQNGNIAYAQFIQAILGRKLSRTSRILDIGGSTGTVVPHATVVDLAESECHRARNSICAGLESWEPAGDLFDGILLCRTVEHLWDPALGCRKLRHMIEPDGWLYVDFSTQNVIKFDHTTYWTLPALRTLLEQTGWMVGPHLFQRRRHRGVIARPAGYYPGENRVEGHSKQKLASP